MAKSFDTLKFKSLLPDFVNKFTYGTRHRFAFQRAPLNEDGEIMPELLSYGDRKDEKITFTDWYQHFAQRPILIKGGYWVRDLKKKMEGVWGSLGLVGCYQENICKWVCVDCDNKEALHKVQENLLPVYKQYEVDPIIEWSGHDRDRAHIWFMTHCERDILESFVEQMFLDANINRKEYEVYPLFDKKNQIIRAPGGYHLRNQEANAITWRGVTSSDPIFILESFIEA